MNEERICTQCQFFDPAARNSCSAYNLPIEIARTATTLCGPEGEDFKRLPQPEPTVWPWVIGPAIIVAVSLLARCLG